MPNLVAAIEKHHKAGKFSKLPLGPIGSYVEVIDPKYRRCVEDTLRPILFAFCVDNMKDRATFDNLVKTQFPAAARCPIITSKYTDKVYFQYQN